MLLFKQNTPVGHGSPFQQIAQNVSFYKPSMRKKKVVKKSWLEAKRQVMYSKAPEKRAMSYHQHLGQILTSTQFKKEKQTSLRKSSDDVKKKHGKYSEPALLKLHAVGSKDSKSCVFSHNKENFMQKVEQEKEHNSKPNKSFNKSVMALSATAEQQLPQTMKAFKQNSSTSGFPDFTRAKGNLPNYASKEDTNMDVYGNLAKAAETALHDLGGAPGGVSHCILQDPILVPHICRAAKETSRIQPVNSYVASLDSSISKVTGNTTSLKFENQNIQAEQMEINQEKGEFCEIFQDLLLEIVISKMTSESRMPF